MIELDQIKYELKDTAKELEDLKRAIDPDTQSARIAEIQKTMEQPGFWDDQKEAQKLTREKKILENKVAEYVSLARDFDDIGVLIEMAEEADDTSMVPEIQEAYDSYKKEAEELRVRTLLSGEYDTSNAIIAIHAGAGGTEAMDWAGMLLRMYTRWAEQHKYKIKMLDLQDDVEAGIKSATLLVEGEYAYGYLKNERGVHRLVRISPFDAAGRRHTSFASLDVTPELDEDVDVEINPEDLRIDTYRSSGAGGQHVNKTDSAIRITHLPTNIVVTCQNERSQHQNKDMAMRVLKSKLLALALQEKKDKIADLKGDFSQITWGSQIRSYVFQPYTLVKDHRTNAEMGNVQAVMDGDIDYFINEKLKQRD